VCVIDGDAAVRDSLATLMVLNGHEVASFATGDEFLGAIAEHPVDCIVCDAELPDISGLELFERVRDRQPRPRFALLLSRRDPTAMASALRQGVDAVFYKPLVNRRLGECVRAS